MDDLPLFPPSASTLSDEVDLLYFYLIAVSGFFATLIATLLVVFVVRYRRRSEDEIPEQIHGSTKLEIVWTAVRAVSVALFFEVPKTRAVRAIMPRMSSPSMPRPGCS